MQLMLANTRETYGLVAQLLHWATALLIFTLLALGIYMTDLPQDTAEEVDYKSWVYSLHKTIGVTVFLVAIARVFWAVIQPHPRLLNANKKLESLAAQTVHWMLYGAIICMPLTGWLHHAASEGFAPIWGPFPQDLPFIPKSHALAKIFNIAHVFTAILLGLAIALHIAGAMKHAVVDRDGTLRRMIPGLGHPKLSTPSEPHFRRLPAVLATLAFLCLGVAVAADYAYETRPRAEPSAEAAPAVVGDEGWVVDREKSRLAIQIIQMGNPVEGDFTQWDAAIAFDPDDLARAKVSVNVDVASISLGAVSDQARGANFLNAAAHPVAQFVSDSFAAIGPGSYEAQGQLTLAGHSQPLTLPFTLHITGDRATMEGEVTIERLAFGIGEKGFSKDDQLGFGVLVKVTLEAEKASPSS